MQFHKKCKKCNRDFNTKSRKTKYCNECRKTVKKESIPKFTNIFEILQHEAYQKIEEQYLEKFLKENYPTLNLGNHKENFMLVKMFEKGCPKEIRKNLWKKTGLSGSYFQAFLDACLKWGVIRKEGKYYYLTRKCMEEPVKAYHRKIINETPSSHTYFGRYFTFYTPENVLAEDFEKEDIVELNKIKQDFAISMRKILERIRRRKARQIWNREIYDNTDINPMVKLAVWVNFLMNTICSHSSKIFLSILQKTLQTKNGKVPREKVIEEWKKQSEEISNNIFNYLICQLWRNGNDEKVWDELIAQFERESKVNYDFCQNVLDKILQALEQSYYMVVICPLIEDGIRREKIPEEADLGYFKKIPWFKTKEQIPDDRAMDALNFLHSRQKSEGTIAKKKCKTAGIEFTMEYELTEIIENQKEFAKDSDYYKFGEWRFNLFNSHIQKSLLNFGRDLGYSKKKLLVLLGQFESTFGIPSIPFEPKYIIRKRHFPKESQIPS